MKLTKGFDLLATAPDGVARLRELILSLAVRGMLVPQDPGEEPASVLLERIRAERHRLNVGQQLELPISDDEVPYAIPASWQWVHLPDIYYGISPSSKKLLSSKVQESGEVPVVDQGKRNIAGYTDETSLRISIPGPVVIFGDHTTEVKYVDFDFVAGADGVKILRPLLQEERFFYHQIRSYRLEDRGYARHFKVLNAKLYALPPLAEQSRISSKVDELMRLCDELESRGHLEAEQHARLTTTLLEALTASDSPHALAENWSRVAAHFDLLLDRPEAVDALEQTIVQLAVRGLLVAQNANDEAVSDLLERIRVAKDRSIAQGEMKRDKPLPAIADEEKPFALPEGWEWARFGDVVQISSGVTLGRKTPLKDPVSLPYLRVANVQRWHLVLSEVKDVIIDRAEIERFRLLRHDLLITEGGDWDKVGRTCLWRDEIDLCLHQNHIFKARGLIDQWCPEWAELFLNSPDARAYFASSAKQTTNLASINMSELKRCVFPIPPAEEQTLIVARVSELRQLCADLRARLTDRQACQANFASALVEQTAAACPDEGRLKLAA
ncbi:restriction endonuclease subunit S [Ralstonia nicotianae]